MQAISAGASTAGNTSKSQGASFGYREISSLGEAVGVSASLVRYFSALFSSADNILSLLKNPAYSDLGSGNFFK